MATLRWAARAGEENVLTTELNSLANGANKITTSPVANDVSPYMYGDFELSVAVQGSARSSGAYCSLYLIPTLDDTNYAFGGDSLDPSANHLVGSFQYDAATNARVDIIRGVLLPNSKFHVLVMNDTGQAFASSGNTLTMRRYNTESV